jgi:quercetin dioxygenase-like cupin family protein
MWTTSASPCPLSTPSTFTSDKPTRGGALTRPRSAVRFTPGARTAWHSDALGQTVYVTEGAGLVRSRGDDTNIRSGDIISTPPDEWHWQGAAPDHFMTHTSITEGVADGGQPETEWGAHVTDAEYRGEQ